MNALDLCKSLLTELISDKMSSGDMTFTKTPGYVIAYVITGFTDVESRVALAFQVTPDNVIYVDPSRVLSQEYIPYRIQAKLTFEDVGDGAYLPSLAFTEITKVVGINDDNTVLTYHRLPYIEYGYGFRDGKVHRFKRPKLYISPVDGPVMEPCEKKSVVTMSMIGVYTEASLIRVHIIGEDGNTISTELKHVDILETPYVHDPNSQFDDMILQYTPVPRIQDCLRGVTLQLIRKFYNISDTITDEFLCKHYRITSYEITLFEQTMAKTADAFWRALEK